jgi:phosphotransferase system enzyme I (PtsI)
MSARLHGTGVSPGVVAGPVARMAAPITAPPPGPGLGSGPVSGPAAGDVDAEAARALDALAAAADDLDRRASVAPGPAAEVLAAQAMMARDPVLGSKVTDRVKTGSDGLTALAEGFGEFRAMLEAAGPYLAERVADLDDVRNRAVAHLLGVPMPEIPRPGHPFVLVAGDLSPAETATLDPSEVLAIVTERGGPTSHTAILAKALGLPAVVACGAAVDLVDGQTVLVDGRAGTVDVSPSEAAVVSALAGHEERLEALAAARGAGRTADGHPVALLVNIGGARDLEAAAAVEPEGVGLFRTEFLFLDRPSAPSVAEQRDAYRAVFDAFGGRKVVVRTLDAGADKPLRFVTQPDEPNPALGVRGLRTARRFPELLDDQLAAIAAAAAESEADVWVMAPMVSTAAEAEEFASRARGHGLQTAGVMVEVPAAALRAEHVAAACDFLSIGTNDLAQYVLAADRMNSDLGDLLDPWQPAVLELIRLTAGAGLLLGKPVGVCGEAASDPQLALVLVGLGVTSLSMAPVALPEVRATLAEHTLDDCRNLAAAVLAAPDAAADARAVASLHPAGAQAPGGALGRGAGWGVGRVSRRIESDFAGWRPMLILGLACADGVSRVGGCGSVWWRRRGRTTVRRPRRSRSRGSRIASGTGRCGSVRGRPGTRSSSRPRSG